MNPFANPAAWTEYNIKSVTTSIVDWHIKNHTFLADIQTTGDTSEQTSHLEKPQKSRKK